MEKILQLMALRTDIITPTGIHYYGIINEILGIGISLCAWGWFWVFAMAGIIFKECKFLKRVLIISHNKVIAISIIAFPIYFLIHKFIQYYSSVSKGVTISFMIIFIVFITQSVVIVFSRNEKIVSDCAIEEV